MLSADQITRVREVIECSEQIVRKINTMLQRDGCALPGFMDTRLRRLPKDFAELDRLMQGMGRIAQDALMQQHLVQKGAQTA